tara:strand:+ start:149 stop:568 length:420 start_codon:yes stop_codon:yes gene_type:complete
VLVSKAIQNLSNGVQFGAKEAFMMPMNEFIVRNLHQTRQFLEQLSALPDADPLDESERARLQEPITLEMRMEAVETCHRLLFVNQQGVIENLQGSTDVQDLEDVSWKIFPVAIQFGVLSFECRLKFYFVTDQEALERLQ